MCYPSHHVAIMSIFVLRFYSNLQTITAIAAFCENINASQRFRKQSGCCRRNCGLRSALISEKSKER
jgi:hypothetical protein